MTTVSSSTSSPTPTPTSSTSSSKTGSSATQNATKTAAQQLFTSLQTGSGIDLSTVVPSLIEAQFAANLHLRHLTDGDRCATVFLEDNRLDVLHSA